MNNVERSKPTTPRRLRRHTSVGVASMLALALAAGHADANTPAGEVEYAKGAASAQQPGSNARILGPGARLQEGDTLATGNNSFAIIKLNDGTKMTVRPNSQMKIDEFVHNQPGKQESSIFSLIKGGFRMVTGAVAKTGPDRTKIRTPTATVGIRGTDFDARLCERDCLADAQKTRKQPDPITASASARVALTTTQVNAIMPDGSRRPLAVGGPVYPGDTLETGAQGHAILVFRDNTKITVQSGTRVKLDDFVFDKRNPSDGVFAFSLLKGGVRALTGLIAKARPSAVRYVTPTATVGIRGTGFDLVCEGKCAGEPPKFPPAKAPDCMLMNVWEGETAVLDKDAQDTSSGGLPVRNGQSSCDNMLLSSTPAIFPENTAPRPDQVNIEDPFTQQPVAPDTAGLFVLVRDGHVNVSTASGSNDIGRGEVVFTNGTTVVRPDAVPTFLSTDPTPRPDQPIRTSQLDAPGTGLTVREPQTCTR
jgi:hypothetical protein